MNKGDVEFFNRAYEEKWSKKMDGMVVQSRNQTSTEKAMLVDIKYLIRDKCNCCARYQSGCRRNADTDCNVAKVHLKWGFPEGWG